ncbi:hypothetical protein BDZ89DRAFT_1079984, partial [Hymenopellis radicata]
MIICFSALLPVRRGKVRIVRIHLFLSRLRITLLKGHSSLTVQFSAQQTWSDLSHNIKDIQNHNAANLSFEENARWRSQSASIGQQVTRVFPSGSKDCVEAESWDDHQSSMVKLGQIM